MDIEQLIERYFEGLTTSEEEATLRRFFTSDEVPEKMQMHKPLFVYFDAEINASLTPPRHHLKPYIYWLSSVAASAAILIGLFVFNLQRTDYPRNSNYVMIDGQCYTDEATIRTATINSLRSVLENEYTTSDNKSVNISEIIEHQLKDFDFLIDE